MGGVLEARFDCCPRLPAPRLLVPSLTPVPWLVPGEQAVLRNHGATFAFCLTLDVPCWSCEVISFCSVIYEWKFVRIHSVQDKIFTDSL